MGDVSTIIYGNTTVTADSYMPAIYTTEVQPVYIHDYYFFGSLLISFCLIGV